MDINELEIRQWVLKEEKEQTHLFSLFPLNQTFKGNI